MKFISQTSPSLSSDLPTFKCLFPFMLGLMGMVLILTVKAESFSPYVISTDSLGKAEITHVSTEVEAVLDGEIINAEITQVYENRGESALECECLFPLTDGKFLGVVEVKINGKPILENYTGEFLILEVLPHEKVELKVSFTEILEIPNENADLI